MRLRFLLGVLLVAIHGDAQTRSRDACAPPPGSVPPSLPAKLLAGQGNVRFPITTKSAEAQAFFNQGVGQMHSFWSREAERSFLQAAALDPEAPMPHWGIAMVAAGDYRPGFQLDLINGRQPKPQAQRRAAGGLDRAVAASKKALELSAVSGKATRLERLYIDAVAARRNLNAKDPNNGYVKGLRALLAEFPQEVEAKSYLALLIMSGFTSPDKKPRAGSAEAVSLLRDLLARAPDHPGVLHYIIHAWEGSSFAEEAVPASNRYPQTAPDIAHALHMPGHIYSQTGRWREAAEAFEQAAANERSWMKADSLAGNQHHGHNVHYLATVYSFNGEYEKALAAARSLLEFKETPREAAQIDNNRTAWRQGWIAVLRTLVQHERWDEILDGKILPAYEKPRERAWRHWAIAQAHAAKRDLGAARAQAELMDQALADYRKKVRRKLPEQFVVAREELNAHLSLASGNIDRSLEQFQRAARRERALHYNEPPLYPRPVLEVLGRVAMQSGKLAVAEQAFREALVQYPESSGARAGLREILQRQGRSVHAGL